MAYFEFPHTRTYEGDLGYLLKKMKELSDITAYLQEEFAKIVVLTEAQIEAMINAAIAANNPIQRIVVKILNLFLMFMPPQA